MTHYRIKAPNYLIRARHLCGKEKGNTCRLFNGSLTPAQLELGMAIRVWVPDTHRVHNPTGTGTGILKDRRGDQRGGEWESIKILHGIWPISQNQPKSTAYDETPPVLRETMIRTRESQNPEPKTRTQPKLAGKIN
jgi:hypothetical protein